MAMGAEPRPVSSLRFEMDRHSVFSEDAPARSIGTTGPEVVAYPGAPVHLGMKLIEYEKELLPDLLLGLAGCRHGLQLGAPLQVRVDTDAPLFRGFDLTIELSPKLLERSRPGLRGKRARVFSGDRTGEPVRERA